MSPLRPSMNQPQPIQCAHSDGNVRSWAKNPRVSRQGFSTANQKPSDFRPPRAKTLGFLRCESKTLENPQGGQRGSGSPNPIGTNPSKGRWCSAKPLRHLRSSALVGPVGFEPTTKGFKFARLSALLGLCHHPRLDPLRVTGVCAVIKGARPLR